MYPEATCFHCLLFLTTVLSQWDFFPIGNSSRFPRGKPAATESHYTTYGACWVFFCVSIIHRTLTWITGSLMFNVNACNCTRGCTDTCKRVCTENWLWEKNPLPHRESNLRQRRAGPMLYQLSYISTSASALPHAVFATILMYVLLL